MASLATVVVAVEMIEDRVSILPFAGMTMLGMAQEGATSPWRAMPGVW